MGTRRRCNGLERLWGWDFPYTIGIVFMLIVLIDFDSARCLY